MERFANGQKIVIKKGADELIGKTGTVARLRFADEFAWVKLDERPPEMFCAFPADDESGRGAHILLNPADCEAA